VTAEAASSAPAGEAGFRPLAEHLPDLVLLALDPELQIWAATGAALRARGWTPGHFLGKRVPEVGRPADAAITEAYCRDALRGECRRLVTTGKTDRTRVWRFLFVPLPDERGAVIGGMVIARDVTDQRRAERQLLASRRQLAEAQRIARVGSWEWELDSDETSMSEEMARILMGASGSPEVDELLWQVTKDLSAEVTSLRRTIGRLRPLVLVEDGLEAALREEAKSACNRAALATCEVTSELEGRLDPVVETALFRVAQQALANVVDHAEATHVLVAIECTARCAVPRVSDDGCGFDPDHVQVLADIAHFGLIAMRERVEARLPLTDPTEGLGA
jgi:PAS domain S-box-containing protein